MRLDPDSFILRTELGPNKLILSPVFLARLLLALEECNIDLKDEGRVAERRNPAR